MGLRYLPDMNCLRDQVQEIQIRSLHPKVFEKSHLAEISSDAAASDGRDVVESFR